MATRRTTKRLERVIVPEPAAPIEPEELEIDEGERAPRAYREDHEDYEGIETPADEAPLVDEPPHGEIEEDDEAHSPDDALGLYLRQMGAIPLLSRSQELTLAEALEMRRRRYRYSALSNWRTLTRVVD